MTPVVRCECKGIHWDSVVCQRCQGSGFRPMRIDELDPSVPTLAAAERAVVEAAVRHLDDEMHYELYDAVDALIRLRAARTDGTRK